MRRTPLILALVGATVGVLVLSNSALAKGRDPSSTPRAAGAQSSTSSNTTPGPSDQDVPGRASDPSYKSSTGTETHDNGLGNDCDPGFGGSNPTATGTDQGNDAGHFGIASTSETEASGCRTSTGSGIAGAGLGLSSGVTAGGTSGVTSGGVSGVTSSTTTGIGGGVEAAVTSAPTGGVLGASGTGVGGSVASALGAALANTGLRTIGLAVLALLLLAIGLALSRRRRPHADAI